MKMIEWIFGWMFVAITVYFGISWGLLGGFAHLLSETTLFGSAAGILKIIIGGASLWCALVCIGHLLD